jgi:hypothetical protein
MKKALFKILILLTAIIASYFCTVGLIKLITLCFGLKFSWLVATGIWLSMFLLNSIFKQ